MFDEDKSKVFQTLKKWCPDLKADEKHVRPGEIRAQGSCEIDGRYVNFYAKSELERFETTLSLAVKVFQNLDTYIPRAKEKICHVCLPLYLEDKDDDESDLTEAEFKDQLTVESISTFYENTLILGFCADGMFGGHELEATSFDKGETFTDVEAVG